MKPVLIIVIVAGLAAAVAGAIAYASSDADADTQSDEVASTSAEPLTLTTSIVTRKDFVDTTEIDGTLGFGTPNALPNRATGVLTWLPEPGTIVGFGDVLYSVNDTPVVYLPGELPAYRAMNTRTDGDDVLQLEEWLNEEGFMEPLNATVDGDYTSYTGDAVEDWYELSYGLTDVDTIADGMVVFGTDEFRISSVSGALGATINGGSVLTTTDTTRIVTVQLDTALTGTLTEGQTVIVELPDGSEVDADVTFVSSVVTTEGQGNQTASWIDVELILDGAGSGFDESPVTVIVDDAIEQDATVVPIPALLALAEGGYAIEVMRDGVPTLVGVQINSFLGNEVSIVGDVAPGDEVVVP